MRSRSRSRSPCFLDEVPPGSNIEICIVTPGGNTLTKIKLGLKERVAVLVRATMRSMRCCELRLTYRARVLQPFWIVQDAGLEHRAYVTAVQVTWSDL